MENIFHRLSVKYAESDQAKRKIILDLARKRNIFFKDLPLSKFTHLVLFFPLSHAQERLWFLWNLIPDDAGYNITGAVRLKG
ncbi:hypothetical protein K6W36_18865, partial [Acetobacter senegalensis]|uniref:hypothetical protein n=1 Tax=Acetobacter senegalensis TaxID=446692 RepID=UPI001EDA362E